jgi:hypothetical protein
MNKYIISTTLALMAALTIYAQSPSPSPTAAPIVVPSPTAIPMVQPIYMALSAAQVQALVTAISSTGVTLPPGIVNLNLRVITTGTNTGGAWVQLRFQ